MSRGCQCGGIIREALPNGTSYDIIDASDIDALLKETEK